jgi:large subunit ribosomal protein L6
MSKIGEKPVEVTQSVQVELKDNMVNVKGSKGEVSFEVPMGVNITMKEGVITVNRTNDSKKNRSLHGLVRSLVQNAITGVEKPWEKRLEVVGTGYRVKMQGTGLIFDVGLSHKVEFSQVDGVTYKVEGNKIVVSGVNKQLVGEVANKIKCIKKPDHYKGKGVRYEGEYVILKPGKKAKTA